MTAATIKQKNVIALRGYDYLALIFSALLGILIFKGPVYLLIGILAVISIIAVWKPQIIPLSIFFLNPLAAGKGGMILKILSPAGFLALWFVAISGMIYIPILARKGLKIHKLAAYLLALVLVTFGSIIFSNNKAGAVEEALRLLSIALMFLLSVHLSGQRQYRITAIKAMLLSAITPLAIGLYQALSGNLQAGGARLTQYEAQTGIIRIYSTFYDAQPFAKYLLIILVILLALLLQGGLGQKAKLIAAAFFILALWELNLTYARGPLIGFAAAALLMSYFSGKLNLLQIALLALLLGAAMYLTGNINRFIELFNPELIAGRSSVDFRISLWTDAYGKILQNPIFGYGAATFNAAFGIIAHNDYLGLWYELGIIGLLLYVLMLIHVGLFAWGCSRKLRGIEKTAALMVLGLTAAIAIGSAAENYFSSNTIWWFFVGLLANLIGIYRTRTFPDWKKL